MAAIHIGTIRIAIRTGDGLVNNGEKVVLLEDSLAVIGYQFDELNRRLRKEMGEGPRQISKHECEEAVHGRTVGSEMDLVFDLLCENDDRLAVLDPEGDEA